jgi:hypothetical protein
MLFMTQGETLDMATSLLVHVHKRHLLGSALIPAYLAGTGCVCAFTILPVPTSEAVPKHTLAFTGQYGTGAGRQGSCLIVHSARDRSSPLCLIWISQRRGRRYSRRLWRRSTAHARLDRGHLPSWHSAQSYGLFCRLDVLRESRYSLVCWRPRRSRSGSRNLLTWRAVR